MLSALIRLIIDNPKKILCVAFGVTLLLGYFIPGLKLESSASQLYPSKKSAERRLFERVDQEFGEEAAMVVVFKSEDIFRVGTLRKLREITEEIESWDAVDRVDSLATAQRISSTEDLLSADDFLAEIPESDAALALLKKDINESIIYGGRLVSEDNRMTIVNVIMKPTEDIQLKSRVSQRLHELIEKHQGPEEIFITGPSEWNVAMTHILNRELKYFAPMVVIIMLIMLFCNFRSYMGFVLPLFSACVGILWTLGIMGFTKIPLTMLSVTLPPVLVAVGCSYAVYVLSAYFYMHADEADMATRLESVLRRTLLAIILCGGTTVLGYFGLWINEIQLVEQMGLAAMIGIVCLLVMTTFVLPSLFVFLGVSQMAKEGSDDRPRKIPRKSIFSRIPYLYRHHSGKFVVSFVVFTLFVIFFIPRLRIETDPARFFRENSIVRQNLNQLMNTMNTGYNIQIVMQGDKPDYFKHPDMLKRIATAQRKMSLLPGVGKTTSLADYIMMINQSFNENDLQRRRIPESADELAQYLLLFNIAGASDDLFRTVTEDYAMSQIHVNTGIANSRKLFALTDQALDLCNKEFEGVLECQATGYTLLTTKSSEQLAHGVLKGFAVAIAVIMILMITLFRSFKVGMIAMIPNVIPVLLLLGIMGAMGIPFNVATCVTVSLALAMAVDDTVHFFVHFYIELKESNHYMIRQNTGVKRTEEQWKAMVSTWHQLYRPMMTTTLTIIMGFSVLLFSDLLPIAFLGFLMALAMILALVTDLILSPILLVSIAI